MGRVLDDCFVDTCDGHLVYGGCDLVCTGGTLPIDETGGCDRLCNVSSRSHASHNVGGGARDVGGGIYGCGVVVCWCVDGVVDGVEFVGVDLVVNGIVTGAKAQSIAFEV